MVNFVIYYKLEKILINYRKTGGDPGLVMPSIYEVDFEYNRTSPDGRSIWIAYADVLHDDLCGQHALFTKRLKRKIAPQAYLSSHI